MKLEESYLNGQKTLGKGEIARYEQFLLFPVFTKGLFPRSVKRFHCVENRLSDQLRDHQKAGAEEKGSPNTTKVQHTKESDSIHYTLTSRDFQQNLTLLVLI